MASTFQLDELAQDALDTLGWYAENRERSFFRWVDHRQCMAMMGQARALGANPGELVQVEPGHLAVVARGRIALRGRDVRRSIVGQSREGEPLELGALVSGDGWRYDWVAQTEAAVIVLPTAAWQAALAHDPMLARFVRTLALHPEFERFRNDLQLAGIDAEEIKATLGLFSQHPVEALKAAGAQRTVVVVGEGELAARATFLGRTEEVARYGAADYFLRSGRKAVDFEAAPGTRVWLLPMSRWRALVGEANSTRLLGLLPTIDAAVQAAEPVESRDQAEVMALDEEDDGLSVRDFRVEPKELAGGRRRKYPMLRQHDQMDCGAACLAMVAHYHGRRVSISHLRSLVHVTREGASMWALKKAAEKMGLQALGVFSGYRALLALRAPFIALMRYHYIVVYEVHEDRVVASDPARGPVVIPADQFKKDWSQNGVLFKPTEAFARYPESPPAFWKYGVLFRGMRWLLFEVFLASLLLVALGLVAPLFLQLVFDQVLAGADPAVMTTLAVVVLSLQLLGGGLEWVRNALLVHVATRLDAKFGALFWHHTLRLPLGFFAVRHVGDITTRVAEINRVRQFFTGQNLQFVIQALSALVYCSVIALYSWKLVALLSVAVPLLLTTVGVLVPRLRRTYRELQQLTGRQQAAAYEQLKGLESLRVINGGVAARWRWGEQVEESRGRQASLERLATATGGVSELFRGLMNTGILLASVLLYLRGELTLGQVVAINSLLNSIVRPLITLVAQWGEVGEVAVSLGRLDDIFTSAPENDPSNAAHEDHRIRGQVDFQSVSFRYGTELSPLVVDGVSLSIQPGQTVAFVGPSGSGKSTLSYLLSRLYLPSGGKVLIDGVDVNDMPLKTLRRQISVVVQDNQIFSGTVLDNITGGDLRPSHERAVDAARLADAHDFISRMPDGYATVLSESGSNLSGGQRQRLNIARALYRAPAIVVMDEATSALDATSERNIVRNLRAMKNKPTTLLIAHRINTVQHADLIVVVRGGRIVEQGNHAQLVERRGYYFQAWRAQSA